MNKEIKQQNNTEPQMGYDTVLAPVILEELNDAELLEIVNDLQGETLAESSIVRQLARQYFGGDSLTQMMFVALKVLPIVAERMKCYSPHL